MGEIIYQGPSPFRLIPAQPSSARAVRNCRRSDCLRIRFKASLHTHVQFKIPMAIDDAKELGRQMIASAEMAEKRAIVIAPASGDRFIRPSGSQESPKLRDCVVELVGLEPTTRVLWNIVVSDQLPWSDTHPDRRGRAKATWPRRGGAVRPRYLVGLEPCSITLWWLMKYQKARKIKQNNKRPTIWIGVRPG